MQRLEEASLGSRLTPLLESNDDLCVSLHLPTHTRGAETRQDPLQLRSALDRAQERLAEFQVRRPDIEQLLAPAREVAKLNENTDFWRHQRLGLSIFLSPARAIYQRLPYEVSVAVEVDRCFNVRPLLPLLTRQVEVYIIALSQRQVRLFEGGCDELREIDTSGWPDELRQLEAFIDAEKSLQHHSSGGPTGDARQRAAVHHGHGADRDLHKTRIFEFFRRLDGPLRETLTETGRPLIPIGVERVVEIFCEATSYPTLSERRGEGNPDHLSEDELLERARAALEPMLEARRRAGLERFERAQGSDRACSDLERIVVASADGLVDSLLVARDKEARGAHDVESRAVDIHAQAKPGDTDLLNLAVIDTLRNSGSVYAHDAEEMPTDGPAGAVLRAGAQAVVGREDQRRANR